MFKNLIIIIVAAAVYLHFYPNEELNEWYSATIEEAQESFSEIADTKAKVAPSKLISVLHQDFKKFSKGEVAYVKKIAETRDSLKAFHKEYCVEPKDNPRLRRQYQLKVCATIDQYRIL
ncbi:hypothetical protein RGQ13_00455 [Thalassotalea psychrophila]|uniref:Uncharacterized protein n=1 Tax=Thalassotalea psychrophila TaxID=3065647 RepID=A0ABY9TVY2_9GAMM|nr:hypothetical protein RGQ13_00455 [Colwelliaceae bacterium SQ149]